MRTLPLLLVAMPTLAAAFPGTFAAPDGAWPEASTTWVMLARQGDETTLTVAPRIAGEIGDLALVIPLPSPVDPGTDAEIVKPEYLERVEAFAAPRLDAVGCDELVTERYYSSPPGCTSYEPEPAAAVAGEAAVDHLGLRGSWAQGDWSLEVVTVDDTADGLQTWLDAHALTLPPDAAELLAAHDTFLVAAFTPEGTPEAGAILEPLQVRYEDPDFVLPLRLGSAGAEGTQELVVTAISDAAAGAVLVDNYARAVVENECLVAPDQFADAYDAALDEALLTEPLPSWTLEYSGPPDRCAPCVGDPLEPIELLDFGYLGEPADAWVSRIRMRYRPGQLDQDLHLALTPHPESQVRFVAHDAAIEFAFPVCGEGFSQDPGVCAALDLPEEGGCNTGRGPAGLVGLALAILAVRRRRVAPAAVGVALLISEPAVAGEPPRLELSGSTTLLSTDRVRFDGLARGGPHLLMPMLGIEARTPLRDVGSGSLGVTGGLRGFLGNATPGEPDMPVSFRFVEPHAGLDLRWGAPGREISPTARAGMQLAVGILDSTVYTPRATLGALLHVGAGVFVGTGEHPLVLELQGSLVPRTDGWGTSFHPNVRLPGWLYFPGSANVSLLVGVGFR